MWEAGLGDGDPEVHIGQLSNALLRNVPLPVGDRPAHRRHDAWSSRDGCSAKQGLQDEGNARQQAARGTYDPAYLNYTMGKLMIRRLRDDWTASRGGRAAWKAFHDQFLSLRLATRPAGARGERWAPTPGRRFGASRLSFCRRSKFKGARYNRLPPLSRAGRKS